MKLFACFILSALAGLSLARAEEPMKFSFTGFSRSTRKGVVLNESFYNPFKVISQQPSLALNTQPLLTNEQVARLIGDRKISGVIFGADGVTGEKVIIGDRVFSIGDELAFYNENFVLARISETGSVRLVKITRQSLQFRISVTGQADRTMEFSLGSFNSP